MAYEGARKDYEGCHAKEAKRAFEREPDGGLVGR
jgi:hypothetical protein